MALAIIIAGTYHQYIQYLRFRGIYDPRLFPYVCNNEEVEGRRGVNIILTGTYWENDAFGSYQYQRLINEGATVTHDPF